jgi:hypothetical protein
MKKTILAVLLSFGFVSCDQLAQLSQNIPSNLPLSSAEIAQGLKRALSISTDTAVKKLSSVNGFFADQALKILLPPEAQAIMDNISKVPLGQELLNRTILSLNKAAEDAAIEAAPIFKKAITDMSFTDAMSILKGTDTAATHYLRKATYNSLLDAFTPKIQNSLSKPLLLNQSSESIYKQLVDTYNKASLNGLLFKRIEGNSLSSYVTNKALQGLFVKVAGEEKEIRNKVNHQVDDLLKRVFAK